MENKKKALGKGLEQLFDLEKLNVNNIDEFEKQIYETTPNEEIVELDLSELRPNPYQPRKIFEDSALSELAASIKENGVFQPIIVKKSIKGYEIIAGERRVRASKLAGLEKVPAIIRTFTDEKMAEISLLENLQRENLNALEEAMAYQNLINKLNLTQDEVSKKVSKSRSYVTNMIGLLRLPEEVQALIIKGDLTMGHARVLSKIEDKNEVVKMAHEIVENKLPVRAAEQMSEDKPKVNKMVRKKERNNEYKYVEDLMRDKLDAKVKIKDKKIEISFTNNADLNRILEIINIKE